MIKKSLFPVIALFCGAGFLHAQVFDTGYTFTYYFSGLRSSQQQIIIPENYFYLSGGNPFTATSTITWQIFDSLPTGPPIASGTWEPGASFWGTAFLPNGVWTDGEGAFRITIVQGSQQIDYFGIHVNGPFDPETQTVTVFGATIPPGPVPEPHTITLILVGVIAIAGWHWRRRQRSV